MSERRYVVGNNPDEVYAHENGKMFHPSGLAYAKEMAEKYGNHVFALVPLTELEAMEKERAEMLDAIKKTLEWFREPNILEPQELSSVVIERMDKAIARAEGKP